MKQLLPYLLSPLFWSVVAGTLGILFMLPLGTRHTRRPGALLAAVGLGLLAWKLPLVSDWVEQVLFWGLAGTTAIAALATITSRSPVYSAIWFAMTLLTTAGLFLLQGALLLGVATVVVYAGAILVMFLFVLMLAQPQGDALYDRLGWGLLPAAVATLAGVLMVGGLAHLLGGPIEPPGLPPGAEQVAAATGPGSAADAENHMAVLGSRLFSKHLVSVEVAGTLLLAALVGAVAIVIQGKQQPSTGGGRQNLATAAGGPDDE